MNAVKTNGYSSTKLKAKRHNKMLDAISRQYAHDSLSLLEKLKKAESRRGKSEREIKRLLANAAKNGVDVPTAEVKTPKKVAKKASKK